MLTAMEHINLGSPFPLQLALLVPAFLYLAGIPSVQAITNTEPQDVDATTPPAMLTTGPSHVPVWLPNLNAVWWNDMIGSIVTSNDNWTSYVVWCRTDVELACTLDSPYSVDFALGPSTLFASTPAASFNMSCQVTSTTEATCTRTITNEEPPSTNTYTVTDMEWGTLTLGEKPESIATLDEEETIIITDSFGNTMAQTDTRIFTTPTATNTPSSACKSLSIPRIFNIFTLLIVVASVIVSVVLGLA